MLVLIMTVCMTLLTLPVGTFAEENAAEETGGEMVSEEINEISEAVLQGNDIVQESGSDGTVELMAVASGECGVSLQ